MSRPIPSFCLSPVALLFHILPTQGILLCLVQSSILISIDRHPLAVSKASGLSPRLTAITCHLATGVSGVSASVLYFLFSLSPPPSPRSTQYRCSASYHDHNKCIPSLDDVSIAINNINLPSTTRGRPNVSPGLGPILVPPAVSCSCAYYTAADAIVRYPPRRDCPLDHKENSHALTITTML